jgi:hypothetical protein
MLSRTLANEWHCIYILCFLFYMQDWAVARQSGCAIQCTNLEGCMQPAFFRGWFYISWMYTPEQNGSSYCQCIILMLTFNTNTYRTYPPLPLPWVPCHPLLPVQITFLSRNQLKPIPSCPKWHSKQSHNHSSVTHISAHWCMCLLISISAVWCKKCGCQWRLFSSVQWLNSWWRRNSWSAVSVMCMHLCHRYQKVGDMKYRWMWHTYLHMSRHETRDKNSDV